MPALPFSEACERNKHAILEQIRRLLPAEGHILEIGSGTGQHAAHFAAALPGLRWQTSDLPDNHASIHAWLAHACRGNMLAPLALDVTRPRQWPTDVFDGVFSANTTQIMSKQAVEAMVGGVARVLSPSGAFVLYGPFNDAGAFTSEGNRRLHEWASTTFPGGGLKDEQWVCGLASAAGLVLEERQQMPSNNRLLVFRSAEYSRSEG